jgi:hypothetical protein
MGTPSSDTKSIPTHAVSPTSSAQTTLTSFQPYAAEAFSMTPDDETGHARKISQIFQLQERFDEDTSIENYVALRRFAPGCDMEIYRFAGVDPLRSLESDLKKFGLDPVLVCGVLDGDDREMDELCLQFWSD